MVIVDDGLVGRIEEQGIDGKVTAMCVLFLAAESIVGHDAARLILIIDATATEGGDLDGFRPHHHVHDAKTPADDARAAEQMMHLLRRGIGGDVKIFGRNIQQQVAHGSPYHKGRETGFLQSGSHLERSIAELIAAYAMLGQRNHAWFATAFAHA